MKKFSFTFVLSVIALATSISCSNPSTNEQSSQSSTQPEEGMANQVADKVELPPVAIEKGVAETVGEENAEILERLKDGPDWAANILGYHEFKTEAYDESKKWFDEAVRLETTQKHMSDHGFTMSAQQLKDLKTKEIDAIELFVYWSDKRIEELTEKVEELNKSGETIKAQVYENEIKWYEELIGSAKISWQRINK